MSAFSAFEMNETRFLGLLENLISVSKNLQNCPAQGLIPREDLASDFVLAALEPHTKKNGGPLEVERVTFVEGRGNVIIKYPGTTDKVVSFIGSHLDVVPADASSGWSRDPFKLTVEGDMLYGRGTTDCLGHVALLTDLMVSLAIAKPQLETSVVVIFIANEENGTFVGVGVDQLAHEGYMESLKNGPVFWVDAADSQPCIGTCGSAQWELKSHGKLFHSGLPHKGINALEFAMDSISHIQRNFFKDFPRHPRELEYNFATQSTFKPTQVSCPSGSLNQIPGLCIIQGDIRVSPFYDIKDIMTKIESYVADINKNPSMVENPEIRGPHSKYQLPDEGLNGTLAFKWIVEGDNGIACRLDSKGYKALLKATEIVLGDAKPYAIGGSLPLIRDLQDLGFDVQISGYGMSSRYHADNEAASMSDLKNATRIISTVSKARISLSPLEAVGNTVTFFVLFLDYFIAARVISDRIWSVPYLNC
jgi:acetylornithine deacetylase